MVLPKSALSHQVLTKQALEDLFGWMVVPVEMTDHVVLAVLVVQCLVAALLVHALFHQVWRPEPLTAKMS